MRLRRRGGVVDGGAGVVGETAAAEGVTSSLTPLTCSGSSRVMVVSRLSTLAKVFETWAVATQAHENANRRHIEKRGRICNLHKIEKNDLRARL